MKFKLFLLFFLVLTQSSFAQLAIIKDKDGFVNARSSPEIKKDNIIGTIPNGTLVYCFEKVGNWWEIHYQEDTTESYPLYVYADRLKPLETFDVIPCVKVNEKLLHFESKNIEIKINIMKFDKKKYQITYSKEGWFEFINGKTFYGTDGEIPKNTYKNIEIFIKGQNISIPSNAYDDLFEVTISKDYCKANYDSQRDILYLYSSNSDAAGAYHVVWEFENGKYKKRYIYFGF